MSYVQGVTIRVSVNTVKTPHALPHWEVVCSLPDLNSSIAAAMHTPSAGLHHEVLQALAALSRFCSRVAERVQHSVPDDSQLSTDSSEP